MESIVMLMFYFPSTHGASTINYECEKTFSIYTKGLTIFIIFLLSEK